MCYHTASPKREVLEQVLGSEYQIAPYPELEFANGFAHPELPAILSGNNRLVQPVVWWFPFDGAGKTYTTLNATCEKMFTSFVYSRSANSQRCIVFVWAFYEWQHGSPGTKNKQPVIIYREDKQPFAFGGIWKRSQVDGLPYEINTASIVTTPANQLLTQIRPEKPRMPLVLDRKDWDAWIDPITPIADIRALCKPYTDGTLISAKLDKHPSEAHGFDFLK